MAARREPGTDAARAAADPSDSQALVRRETCRRWRIAIERRGRLKHAWTVEEERLGAWKPQANGVALTRRGAVSAARRRTIGMAVFRIDRQEEIIAVQESYVPDPEIAANVSAVLLDGDHA